MRPPCDAVGGEDDDTAWLNWYIRVGTDVGEKPSWTGVELTCHGDLDVRGSR
jgi:hypothetical protein